MTHVEKSQNHSGKLCLWIASIANGEFVHTFLVLHHSMCTDNDSDQPGPVQKLHSLTISARFMKNTTILLKCQILMITIMVAIYEMNI